MDDFLYNVRTGNVKNMDKSHRRYDNNRFQTSNRQQPAKDRRKGYVNYRSLSTDQFSVFKDFFNTIIENQARQAVAMEKIADCLERLIENKTESVALTPPTSPAPKNDTADPVNTDITDIAPAAHPKTRAEMVAFVHDLREQGLSYEKIADVFEAKRISTLSGRGKWRGQTIYRLFHEG
ncbi:MAG: hypothetical protein CSB22_00400 [Deltaproteobacteria bacterium]|nr:MAG: hypothetical protein CSB22_00400 [Deltaproteobacteria bacterium]